MASRFRAPAKCDLRRFTRIRFYQADGNSAAEIHRRMSRVYGKIFMSDCAVREWCRKFKHCRTDTHDEEGQGRKSVAKEDLIQRVPGNFWSSLNRTCLSTQHIAPT
ncbi:hypothetical protein AVEN_273600-1 [Araneus ventricosus]|uniref:Mos1 transposase HTH domain-containing protein n=1 Tax=Araneus ventricosus TaxID=182803 RepID=A0A4Y2NZM5_ARAVE|nr:hypothetical protein AVEN_273600-1 [Araneus ventricosus]